MIKQNLSIVLSKEQVDPAVAQQFCLRNLEPLINKELLGVESPLLTGIPTDVGGHHQRDFINQASLQEGPVDQGTAAQGHLFDAEVLPQFDQGLGKVNL